MGLVEDDLAPLKWEMRALREQMINREIKMDEMENKMRRNNVWIVVRNREHTRSQLGPPSLELPQDLCW